MRRQIGTAGFVAVLVVLALGALANAATIPIANASFEDPVLADGARGAATSWTATGTAGAFNPTGSPTLPDGSQVGYLNGGASLTQALGVNSVAGVEYRLSAFAAREAAGSSGLPFKVELFEGASLVSSFGLTIPNSVTDWLAFDLAGTASGGQELKIKITNLSSASGPVLDVDNFSLVPEPSTVAGLAGMGLMGLLLAVRRWRRG